MLIDIVSKNGNLLLSVPVRGDGSIDEKEVAVVKGIAAWMKVNSESIYKTRPWKAFGEGPNAESANPLSAQGFNEGIKYTPADVRYVCKGKTVYASLMGWPETTIVTLKQLGTAASTKPGKVKAVTLLGYGSLKFKQGKDGLVVHFPTTPISTGTMVSVLKVNF